MNLGLVFIVIGIGLALLGYFLLGVVLFAIGVGLLIVGAARPR